MEMSFDFDPSKQAQEVIFSCKFQKTCHPSIYLNNKSAKQVPSQKYLGMVLNTKLNFQKRLKDVLNKFNKAIGLLRKLQNILPCGPLLTIYKSFIRSYLDYGDVIYDQHCNNTFQNVKHTIFKNSFFPPAVIESNNLDKSI